MILGSIIKAPKIVAYSAAKEFAKGQAIGRATKLIQNASKNDTRTLIQVGNILKEKPDITDSHSKKHMSGDVLHTYLDKVEKNQYEILTQEQIYHLRNRADRLLIRDGHSLRWEVGR